MFSIYGFFVVLMLRFYIYLLTGIGLYPFLQKLLQTSDPPSFSPTIIPSSTILSSEKPTFYPTKKITPRPTSAQSASPPANYSLEERLGDTLPNNTRYSINSMVNLSDHRIASNLAANAILSIIFTVKENNFTSVAQNNSNNTLYNDLTRAAECTFHYANMNATLAISLLSIASYSSIQSNEDAIAYMNSTSKIGIAAFSTVNNNLSDWKSSCKYLANKQLLKNLPQQIRQ
jgi:hypothetical protein